MARNRRGNRHMRYVVMAATHSQGGAPGRPDSFFAEDGSVTQFRDRAAKFFTGPEAFDFAKRKNIDLNQTTRYVHSMDFSESELRQP